MTRLAHLTDVHLCGQSARAERLSKALEKALWANCTHLVLTGDLTEGGKGSEFEELSEMLRPWRPDAVSIVPGNHDLGEGGDWAKVLHSTSLRRFAETSAPGSITDLGDCAIVALSTQFPNRALFFRALGTVSERELAILGQVAMSDPRPVIALMHHGPQWHPLQFFDGLTNRHRILGLLAEHPRVHVLCGHDHRILDIGRIHVAGSVADHPDPLRLYDVVGSELVPIYRSEHVGQYLTL